MSEETIEEAAKNESEYLAYWKDQDMYKKGFIEGAAWQAQRMYSEEEVKSILLKTDRFLKADLDIWFEQFKKQKP